jgi:copper chaperone CopZ
LLHCAHHVPGRLRLRSSVIKGNVRRAGSVEGALRSLEGVYSVAANTLTGSVVIEYDAAVLAVPAIRDHLKAAGFEVTDALETPRPQLANAKPQLGERLVTSVVETIVERSAVALISALT